MSLRARLALLVAGAVAVAVVLAVVATYRVAAEQQRDALDEALVAQAEATSARARLVVNLTSRFPGRADPFAADDLYFQLLTGRGAVRTPADQPALPVSAEDEAVARGQAATVLRDVVVDGAVLRQVTVPLDAQVGNRTAAVQLARPTAPVEEGLADLRRRLLLIALVGVAGAGVLGLLVARRALRPVRALTATAEHVAATQELGARIVVERDDELGRLADSFNEMLAALATSREQQHRLVTDASHELRTPLTSLRTNVELLARAPDLPTDERRQVVEAAAAEVTALSELVAELVELATDARRGTEDWTRLDLAELATAAAERTERRHGVEVVVRATPTPVTGSPHLLDRAVANLLENAVKWRPVDTPIEVVVADGWVRVLDRGPGVADAELDRLWDRFWRAPGSQDVPGSGLGLAIVRDVVEAHGGQVGAANRPDGGLDIGFHLPPA